MITLPIIIPGKGRIPRLGSIGPKLEPIELPLETIEAIVRAPYTPGAAYLNIETGDRIDLNRGNYRTVWDKFARDPNLKVAVVAESSPEEPPAKPDLASEIIIDEVPEPEPIVEPDVPVQPEIEESLETMTDEVEVESTELSAEPVENRTDEPSDDNGSGGFKRISKPENQNRNHPHKKR